MNNRTYKSVIDTMCKTIRIWGLLLLTLMFYVSGASDMFTHAKANDSGSVHDIRLVDEAGLLSDSEYNRVLSRLDEISEKLQFELVIVTKDSIGGASAMEFSDDYFDYNNYGYGEERDGALLLINMEEREWYISTSGLGIKALTDSRIQKTGEHIASYLGDSDNEQAFQAFIDDCDKYVTRAKGGRLPFPWGRNIVIALAAGLAVGVMVIAVLKGQLKSVTGKGAATDYVVNNSMKVDESRDIFLYANISKRPRPKESTSGSSTHSSSSGRSHGGGGGHF